MLCTRGSSVDKVESKLVYAEIGFFSMNVEEKLEKFKN
jgi:hypothetical protein